MKKVLFLLCLSIITIMSLYQIISLRIVPSTQIWDKYNVLYVDIQADTELLIESLNEEGIQDILSINHNPFPALSTLAPVQIHKDTDTFTHEQLQNMYFFDKDENYHLFYIPQEYVQNVYSALDDFDYVWGIDTQASVPAIPFVLAIVFSFLLFINSKNKMYFLCLLLPYILFSITTPFYHIAASVSLLSYAVFRIQKYWHRQYWRERIKKEYLLFISVSFMFIASLLLGLRGLILFSFSSIASISSLYIVYTIKTYIHTNAFFQPTLIYNAFTVPTNTVRKPRYALIPFISFVFLTIISTINVQPQQKNTSKALHIPSPSGYTVVDDFSSESYIQTIQAQAGDRLPDLTDYIDAAWKIETYPFMRVTDDVQEIVQPGESVSFTQYVSEGFTLIEQTEIIASFDDAYINNFLDIALANSNAGAEKLLASQAGFSRVSYATSASIKTSFEALIFLVFGCIYITIVLIFLKLKRQ